MFRKTEAVDSADVFRGSEEEGGHEDSVFRGLGGSGVEVGDEGDVEVSRSVGGEPGFDGEDGGCGRVTRRHGNVISMAS